MRYAVEVVVELEFNGLHEHIPMFIKDALKGIRHNGWRTFNIKEVDE